MKYGEFLKKELFVPLGMKDTDFYVPGEKLDRLAMTYEQTAGEMKEFRDNSLGIRLSMDVPPAYEAGGAGLVSTIEDYSRFAAMLINKGSFQGRQILKPASVEYMTTHKLIACQQEWFEKCWEMNGYSYGNLMRVMTDPWKAPFACCEGEYGWDGWLGCYFANFPKENMTILMMMQKKDAGTFDLTRKLRNVLLLGM